MSTEERKYDEDGVLMRIRPHTRGKLGLLRRYYRSALPVFSQKCVNDGDKTIIVDAFCGSGKYDDPEHTSGSPLILISKSVCRFLTCKQCS